MYLSKLFGKAVKDDFAGLSVRSHILLLKAGFIRESVAGRYFLLPMGMRVVQKIKKVVKTEMDKAGAQEMICPVLHPLELWQETNRTNTVGFELMTIKDRRGASFALGGTAEEMMIDVVRKFQISYKDLPLHIYQFSTKFRDEMRAKGGLFRLREFIMKDGYSFHANEQDFKIEYDQMKKTYSNIYSTLGLNALVVEADNGYIGGEYCHEFIVESDAGEGRFLSTKDGTYCAHEDVAVFHKEDKNTDEPLLDMHEIEAVRGNTMQDGVDLHKLPLWLQIKDVMFVDETGRFVLAVIRGDYEVNETKLLNISKSCALRAATDEEIIDLVGSVPGFISPVGIRDNLKEGVKLLIVADDSLTKIHNMYGGSNRKNIDLKNVNINKDYEPDIIGDIAMAQAGFKTQKTFQELESKKGVEVGNIFQLGYHYSTKMKNATYIDSDNKEKPYYMGCYGIGIERTMTTVAEIHNDEKGLVWPEVIAPYKYVIIPIGDAGFKKGEDLYQRLTANGVDVAFDDRSASAGYKFKDADLIGYPYQIVISDKTLANGENMGELVVRKTGEKTLINIDEIIS
ncbi:MAG: proline--tRNA ligase [Candidatus Absconditabacteria bacterium]